MINIMFIEANCDLLSPGKKSSFIDILNFRIKRYCWGEAIRKQRLKPRSGYTPPLGILAIATYLVKKLGDKIRVRLLPVNLWDNLKQFSKERLIKEIRAFNPDIVLISNNHLFDEAIGKMIAKIIKDLCPHIRIVLGGLNASYRAEELISFYYIDYIIVGEGEVSLPMLIEKIISNDRLDTIPGLVYKKDGKTIKNKNITFIGLEEYRIDKDILREFSEDYLKYSFFAKVETTRGCPYGCSFCVVGSYWGKRIRFRKPEHVIEEIASFKSLGAQVIKFIDSNLTINSEHIIKICKLIKKEGLNDLVYIGQTRVDLINSEVVKYLDQANIRYLCLGLEAANVNVLERTEGKSGIIDMKKKALEALRIIKGHNINVWASFVAGLPFETQNTLKETENFIRELFDNGISWANIRFFLPCAGTPIWNNPDQFAVNIHKDFIDHWFLGMPCLDTDNFSAEEWRKIYLRLVKLSISCFVKSVGFWKVRQPCFSWAIKKYISNRLPEFRNSNKYIDLRSLART